MNHGNGYTKSGCKFRSLTMNKSFPICYETFGNPSNPCVILIMGISGQLIHWPNKFTQGLVRKGFYVVTFDNRDAGLSQYYDHINAPSLTEAIVAKQQGRDLKSPYTLNDMAADVILLMKKLCIPKAHLVGISMGGIIAQLVAIEYPKFVLSLTCIASTSGDPNLPPAKPEVLAFFFSPRRQDEDIETAVTNKMQLHRIYNHPDHIDEDIIRKLYIKTYNRSHKPSGFKRQLLALIAAEPRGEKLKRLQVPSLIIHGDYDPVFPLEHGKELAKCLSNSHLEIIAKMGHGLPECLCDKIVDLIVKHIIKKSCYGGESKCQK